MAAQKVSFFKTCSGFSYDVFLSFRGEDTRSTFTDHLYTALVYAGFRTFRDDPELERGENIKQKPEQAIQQSRSSVIVFSKNYTSSGWCLDELVMILEHKRTSDHVVIPVFYDVEPSDVRKQAENLAKVPKYQENQSTGKLNGWRAALREVSDLSGMVLRNEADGHEAKFIQNIVGVIQDKLDRRVPLSDVQEVLQKKLLYVNSVLDDAEGKQLNNPTVKDWLNDIPRISKFLGSTSEGCINNINRGNQGDFINHVHGDFIKDVHIEVPRVVGVFQDKQGRPLPLSVVQEILQKKLLYVNSVVDDAEGKQMNNPALKDWFNDLKEAAYDAEDLLQEIKTEALRQEMEPESAGSSTSKLQELVSRPPSHAFDSALTITEAEKVLERLEAIVKQKEQYLGLEASAGHKRLRQATTRETASLVDDSGVYGRDQDKEAIIILLLSNDDAAGKKMSVIPIIGMGGIGKTTLAQLVYNDIRVKQHFELQAWVCISDVEFDVTRITQTIYESVTGKTYCGIAKLDLLQNALREELLMKRFLLVLDDVWNENYMEWDKLRQPFESGDFGSKIIVTARNQRVASAMCTLPSHHLMQISDVDCWLLFAKHAFGNADLLNSQHPDLACIGRQIATKCKGLPLAAKSLGGLLRSELNVEEWVEILKSDIWELSEKETNILPALWLSYHYLPSHLKRCFAHCAIFPKDYYFTKSKMVLLWMAEDLLQPEKKKMIELVGHAYFNDLISRSFFQSSSTPELDPTAESESHFTMHDLINDLAKFVSGEFSSMISFSNPHLHKRLRISRLHNIVCQGDALKANISGMKYLTGLILKWGGDIVCQGDALKADISIAMKLLKGDTDDWIQDSIQDRQVLEQLQPHSNLKLLRIESYGGTSFPNWVGDHSFSNLSSVALISCKLCLSFPPLGQLPSLVKLHIEGAKVESVGLEFYGCRVKPFRSLNELSFVDMLEWQEWCYDVEEEGEIFPNLCKLTLKICPKLTKMFPKLESLQLSRLNSFTGCLLSQESKFLSLSLLKIEECPKFECFPDGGIDAPKLKNISIDWCRKFRLLPEGMHTIAPSLEELTIRRCPEFKSFPQSVLAPALVTLKLDGNEKLLANGRQCGLQRLNSLLTLTIAQIEFSVFPEEGLLPTSLTHLRFFGCPNLTTLDGKGLRNLGSLQGLGLFGCPQLQFLPEEGLPTSLSQLQIYECPFLERRLQRGKGEDWTKIAHIPHIWLGFKKI